MKVGDKVTVEAVVTMVGEELVAVSIRGLQGVEHVRLRHEEVNAKPVKAKPVD